MTAKPAITRLSAVIRVSWVKLDSFEPSKKFARARRA
jgi:hypothetical protein